MQKACLVIVFNHRYDKNIPVLRKMYAGRFSWIWFLMPFYDGDDPSVIPVYESSNYFQSFFAQGLSKYYDSAFTHYIFLGDDCILNTSIDESNFGDLLGLAPDADFVPSLNSFESSNSGGWWHTFKGIDFFGNRKGAEIARELPSRDQAIEKFRQHGLESGPLSAKQIFGSKTPSTQSTWKFWLFKQYHLRYKWRKFRKNKKIDLPYPITGSYSDIIIVTGSTVKTFSRYCGIMAAAGVFVEIAIPTALVLASSRIMTEDQLKMRGKALWTAAEIASLEAAHHLSLRELLDQFPAGQMFHHPVKLSKWKNDL